MNNRILADSLLMPRNSGPSIGEHQRESFAGFRLASFEIAEVMVETPTVTKLEGPGAQRCQKRESSGLGVPLFWGN